MTTTNSLNTWPALLSETSLTVHTTKSRRSRTGVVKRLDPPAQPDELTVRKLNELATKHPFCRLHSVKKHEMF